MITHAAKVVVLVSCLAGLRAQDFRIETIEEVGIKLNVSKKLGRVPLNLGNSIKNLKAQFMQDDEKDRVQTPRGAMPWEVMIYDFPNAKPDPEAEPAKNSRFAAAHSFEHFVKERDLAAHDRKFNKKGEVEVKGTGKNLPYKYWEYLDSMPMTSGFKQPYVSLAGVYTLADREVGIVVQIPAKKENQADAKWVDIAKKMLGSVQPLNEKDVADAGKGKKDGIDRDKFADTPDKKAQVERARKNILGLKGWDYFTTPNYVWLWSWPPDKDDKRIKMQTAVRGLADRLEKMRELYIKHYPLHPGVAKIYSVVRVCCEWDEYTKYGGPQGSAGYFSPGTKELVMFYDVDYPKSETEATCFHEGWHQYADSYFRTPRTKAAVAEGEEGGPKTTGTGAGTMLDRMPGAQLHRWFDEGHGDYFGGFVLEGTSWTYKGDKGRKTVIRGMVSSRSHVPLREIVTWNHDRYYGAKAGENYAQGYAMIDFFQRGPTKLGKKWDESWSKVLETYKTVMLETGDQKKAVEKAFAGVDWEKLEEAWIAWVKDQL